MSRQEFIYHHIYSECREWRFQGSLGFGGKFYSSNGRWRVSCYSEDSTPEREQKMLETNQKLNSMRKLVDEGVILNTPSIGLSEYVINNNTKEMGNSYCTLSFDEILDRILKGWDSRVAGNGEMPFDLTRKILVPVDPRGFFCPPRAELHPDMQVQAAVRRRAEGEDCYVETYVTPEEAAKFGYVETPAASCNIVLYSAEALLENNGTRTTDCEWEIVTYLANAAKDVEPMAPLVMARNMLEMPGGTKGVYTAEEFATSIYYHSKRGIRVRP